MAAPTSTRTSQRASATKTQKNIAAIAANDLLDSDYDSDEFPLDLSLVDLDVTLVNPDSSDGEEEGDVMDVDVDGGLEASDDSDKEEEEGSEAEEEEDEESEESEEEDVTVGKRKRTAKKPAKEQPVTKKTRGPAKKSAEKPAAKKPTKTAIFTLHNSEPFNTLKAQILVRIASALHPAQEDYNDYNITFTVPRQVTDPVTLDSDETYTHLVGHALKINSTPCAKIVVEAKEDRAGNKENDAIEIDDESGDKTKRKGRPKTRIPNAQQILPGNIALNEKIGILRARWQCPTPGGPCGSEHCFVQPDMSEHFPLSNAHFESWGSAMLKGKTYADEDKPPNGDLFDGVNDKSLAARSPILQRRLDLKAEKNAATTPQINFNFPPEMLQIFRPAPAHAPALAPAPAPAPVQPALAFQTAMLIPHPLVPGPKMSIEEFCKEYELDDDIRDHFRQHKFKSTSSFQYIELAELKGMDFLAGEVAELKVAIAGWAWQP
ncbi:hypothetical protein DFH07DRAFT_938223 [Mycena maculata]|uniref:Uncharacterized protein n=1 Tax=Mycena maculata TaxID=230809 RepID=A0AAD7JQ93_9AGAR|nr:hypothetical protein DFH07DRAFT_938223 [Mycena maculata]